MIVHPLLRRQGEGFGLTLNIFSSHSQEVVVAAFEEPAIKEIRQSYIPPPKKKKSVGMSNLMRIGDETCDALGRPGGGYHARPLTQAACSLRRSRQTLEALIQHPLDRALRDAKIARAEALIKPANALLSRNLPYRRDAPTEERPW